MQQFILSLPACFTLIKPISMKKILLFTLVISLYLDSYAQQTFTNTYGTASDEYFSDLSVKNSNALIAATNKNNDVFTMAANKTGDLVWSKAFGTSLIESNIHCIITADNGSLFFLRRWNTGDTPAEGAVLVKCNKNGDIVWSKNIRSSKYKYIIPVAVMENDDNSIMLLYEKNNAWNDTTFIALAKFTGTTLDWETTINPVYQDALNIFIPQTLTRSNNGYIIGTMQNNELSDQDSPVLFYVSNNGAMEHAKHVRDQFSAFSANHTYLQNVFERNGKTTIIGYYYGDNADEAHFIMSFKPSDNIITARFIPHDLFALQQYMRNTKTIAANQKLLNNAFLTPEYGMLVASSAVYSGQRNNIFLARYDSLGRICPSYTLPVFDSSVKKYNYILVDEPHALENDNIYLDTITYTIRDAGNETAICAGSAAQKLVAEEVKMNLTLSPNPAKNFINVDFILAKTATVQFDISSVNGKPWLTKNTLLQAGKIHEQLNIESLLPGLYFLKITTNGQQYNLSFMKE